MGPLAGPISFFSPSVVEDENPVRPTQQRSCQSVRQRRRRNSILPSPKVWKLYRIGEATKTERGRYILVWTLEERVACGAADVAT